MGYSFKEGNVIYTRGERSQIEYWRRIHHSAVAEAGNVSGLYAGENLVEKYKIAGQNLISLGQAEQEKEIALIKAAGFEVNDSEDVKIFIKKFNEVLMGKEQFEMAKDRLKNALDKKNSGKENRAPTIASWFTSYLGTALNKNINNFLKQTGSMIAVDFSVWHASLNDIVDKSIDDAFQNMLTKISANKNNEIYGDSEQWKDIYSLSQQIQGFNNYFKNMVRSKINFDRLENLFLSDSVKIKNKKNKGIRKFIDSKEGLNLRNEQKSRSIGGSVEEFIMSIVNSFGAAVQTANSSGGRVFSSEQIKTDTVQLFSYSSNIDSQNMAQEIVNSLDEELKSATSLQQASQIMEAFYNNYLADLDNSFIVYGSTKSYSMSDSFKGFKGGEGGSLESAQAILSKAGIGNSNAIGNFLNVAYNTAEGAIFNGQRMEIQEELKMALMQAAAYLLFDDYITIGQEKTGGAQAIHVLQLEGVNIPMSTLLLATGKAMENASMDMNSLIKVKVNLPKSFLYPEPIKTSDKAEVKAAWAEQFQVAKAESNFSLKFLVNFKTMITQWI